MFLTEKVFAEQVEFGARFNFHVAVNCHLASEPHGFFVADKGQAGHGVQSAGCDRRRDWHAKASLFYQAHFAGVFHAGHNLNTTSAALRESMAIEDFIELHQASDRQQLRNLQRQASREMEQKKPPAAARKLFAYLRELSE